MLSTVIFMVNGNPKIFPMSYYNEIAIITIYDDDCKSNILLDIV